MSEKSITIKIYECRDCPEAIADYENESMIYRNHCRINSKVYIGRGETIPDDCPKLINKDLELGGE